MDTLELFRILVKERGSDLIIKANACPAMRVDGRIKYLGESRVPEAFARALLEQVLPEKMLRKFEAEGEADTSYEIEGIGRFRANVFLQRGRLCLVFRHVLAQVPDFKQLNLPVKQIQELASLQRGLVLVTGMAGSGKTTTLAAMLEFMNHHFQRHIVAIEDPIEYVFTDRKSMINQREVGFDTRDFNTALRQVVRQTPDVILIGEMRDQETVAGALSAAETGHLVLSSLHTVNAVQTVERILSFFPAHQHEQIRLELSLTLEGILSQRLLPRKNSEGRVPAVEILLGTPRIRELLYGGATRELVKAVEEGAHYYGTQTFLQSLRDLFSRGLISIEDALAAADNPDELKLELRGVTRGSSVADFDFKF
ncbi:MAG: type IV pilus twitching motility protein PilT [Planctomycetota bacterium]